MTFSDPQPRTGFFGWTNAVGHPEGFRTTEVSSWGISQQTRTFAVYFKNGSAMTMPDEAAKRFMVDVVQCVEVKPKSLVELVGAQAAD